MNSYPCQAFKHKHTPIVELSIKVTCLRSLQNSAVTFLIQSRLRNDEKKATFKSDELRSSLTFSLRVPRGRP